MITEHQIAAGLAAIAKSLAAMPPYWAWGPAEYARRDSLVAARDFGRRLLNGGQPLPAGPPRLGWAATWPAGLVSS